MSQSDDFFDLPVAVSSQPPRHMGLSEQQMDRVVETGTVVAVGVVDVVKTAFEVWRLREATRGEIEKYRAETERLQQALHGELEKVREQRAHLREQGSIVVDILRSAAVWLRDIPEADAAARSRFIEQLPALVDAALQHRK